MRKEPKEKQFKAPHPKGITYFEGTLQLRNPTEEVVAFVWDEVDRNEYKQVYIQKAVRVNNGLDYYITSNQFLRALGKRLVMRFGGEMKMSAKLFTRDNQTSKEVHRLTVMFRVPEFVTGQEVEYKGETYNVKGMGKRIFLQNPRTGKKVVIGQRDISKIKKLS